MSGEGNEEALIGGNMNPLVVRVGDHVRRAGGPWTSTVHRFLRHLRAAGFVDGPMPVSIEDDGTEVLTFIPGRALLATDAVSLSLAELTTIGALCGRFHRASLSYVGSEDDNWNRTSSDVGGPWRIVCHNDLAPWNLIARPDGWGLIDWDFASPGRPEWDLAWAIHTLVPTFPDVGVPDKLVVERMLAFWRGYEQLGILDVELDRTVDTIVERLASEVNRLRTESAAGSPAYIKLVEDGHLAVWEGALAFVRDRLPRWKQFLSGESL